MYSIRYLSIAYRYIQQTLSTHTHRDIESEHLWWLWCERGVRCARCECEYRRVSFDTWHDWACLIQVFQLDFFSSQFRFDFGSAVCVWVWARAQRPLFTSNISLSSKRERTKESEKEWMYSETACVYVFLCIFSTFCHSLLSTAIQPSLSQPIFQQQLSTFVECHKTRFYAKNCQTFHH